MDKRLKEKGFDGIISIEEASNTGKSGIKIAEEFIRNKWRISGWVDEKNHNYWKEKNYNNIEKL